MNLHRSLMFATALTAVLAAAPLRAQGTMQTNPGFNPNTGQINPGGTGPTPSSSTDIRKIPSQAEVRAAFRQYDDPNPVLGPEPAQQTSTATNNKTVSPAGGSGDPTTATQGQAAIGGPMSPGASAGGGGRPAKPPPPPIQTPRPPKRQRRPRHRRRRAGRVRWVPLVRPCRRNIRSETTFSIVRRSWRGR